MVFVKKKILTVDQAISCLLEAAARDARLLTRIRMLASQEGEKRKSFLSMFLQEMKMKGESEEILTAFKFLNEDGLAGIILEKLEEN